MSSTCTDKLIEYMPEIMEKVELIAGNISNQFQAEVQYKPQSHTMLATHQKGNRQQPVV